MPKKSRNPSICSMVESYLYKHGYTGLYNSEVECGCVMRDLMPCTEPHQVDCKAGYERKCNNSRCECTGFHVGPRPPRVRKPTPRA